MEALRLPPVPALFIRSNGPTSTMTATWTSRPCSLTKAPGLGTTVAAAHRCIAATKAEAASPILVCTGRRVERLPRAADFDNDGRLDLLLARVGLLLHNEQTQVIPAQCPDGVVGRGCGHGRDAYVGAEL